MRSSEPFPVMIRSAGTFAYSASASRTARDSSPGYSERSAPSASRSAATAEGGAPHRFVLCERSIATGARSVS